MNNITKLNILLVFIIAFSIIFVLDDNILISQLRIPKLISIYIIGSAIGVSSIVFQSITNNRILTPEIIGFDSLYLFIQSLTVFILPQLMYTNTLYIINILIMSTLSVLVFRYILKRYTLYKLLLIGIIIGILLRSISTLLISIMSPNTFDILQTSMFANFSIIKLELLPISIIVVISVVSIFLNMKNDLDAYSLGNKMSHSIGLDTTGTFKKSIFLISILVAVSVATIGPISFLGLFIANITKTIFDTYKHSILIPGSIYVGILLLIISVYLDDRIFVYTNLPIVLDGLGSMYFIYLCIRR